MSFQSSRRKGALAYSHSRRGASLTGYGLTVGLIAVLAIAAISNVGDGVVGILDQTTLTIEPAAYGPANLSADASATIDQAGIPGLCSDVAITNASGSTASGFSDPVVTGDYTDTGCSNGCTGTLAVGESCTVGVRGNGSANGAISGSLQVTAANGGTVTVALTGTASGIDACAVDGAAPGTLCLDGSRLAGTTPDGNVLFYVVGTGDQGSTDWQNSGSLVDFTTGVNDLNTGESNTDTLATFSGGGAPTPYNAATTCYNLSAHGHDDWYLPAWNELQVLYDNHVAIGGFNTTSGLGTHYWSSSETTQACCTGTIARTIRFDDGSLGNRNKDQSRRVRCVRK